MRFGEVRKLSFVLAVISLMLGLLLLGGCEEEEEELFAPAQSTVGMTQGVASAVAGTAFSFPNGIPGFGTTGTPTTLTFGAGGTTATVTTDTSTLQANVGFGSCTFTVTEATGIFLPDVEPDPPAFNVGDEVTFEECEAQINIEANTPTGQTTTGSITLTLDGATSDAATADVEVTDQGDLIVNGQNTGVNVGVVTGVTGAGG